MIRKVPLWLDGGCLAVAPAKADRVVRDFVYKKMYSLTISPLWGTTPIKENLKKPPIRAVNNILYIIILILEPQKLFFCRHYCA